MFRGGVLLKFCDFLAIGCLICCAAVLFSAAPSFVQYLAINLFSTGFGWLFFRAVPL